ncbi:MAG TPA: discoidin domain-containing protein [Ruminiclostridium sp.]
MKKLKGLLCTILSFSLISTSLLLGGITAQAATSAEIWTESSYVNVFKDTLKPAEANTSINLTAAKNEFEAAQIIVRRDQAFTIDSVTFTNLSSGSGSIASSNLKYQFVEYEYLDGNSGINYFIRSAPGYFPDALSNDTSLSVAANTTQPIWVRAYIPKTVVAGIYTGTATVNTSLGNYTVSISIDVKNVIIPDSKDAGTFDCALWTQFAGPTSWYEPYDDMWNVFQVNRYTTQWWSVMESIAQMMKDYRNNNLTVNMCYLLMDGGTYKDGNGTYYFNWSKFDQVIQFFIDRGAVKRLEGLFTAQPFNDRMNSEILDTDSNGRTFRTYANPDSALSNNWIDQFIPALRNHLDSKGWTSKWWMHIGDEPASQQTVDDYKVLYDRVKAAWNRSDLKIGDAIFNHSASIQLAGYPNMWIPQTGTYDENQAFYDGRKALGEELWYYNCGAPAGMYLNRFLDQQVWNQRSTIWYAFQRNITGYLHWGFNAWHFPMNGEGGQPNKGDGWIVKADVPNYKLKPTIRYESLRDGIEDYELLKIVEQSNPGIAKSITESIVTSGTNYLRDTDFMIRTRANLVRPAAGPEVFGTDLAYNKTTTASSQVTGYEASKVLDNNSTTSWKSSAGGTQWIQVDLGAQYKLDGVKLKWGAPYATSYKIQTSYDGTIWSDVLSTTSGNGGNDFVGKNVKARYIRIYCTSSSGAQYVLDSLEAGGVKIPRENLAGGKSYDKNPYPNPASGYDDTTGKESTDGILAGLFTDTKSYGYQIPVNGSISPQITVDLGSIQTVGEVKLHGMEEYQQDYRTESVKVLTSTDGVNFTQKGYLKYPNGDDAMWHDVTFPATSARYIRVIYYKTYGVDRDWLFLDEIEVYAPITAETTNLAQGRSYTKSENPSGTYPDTSNTEATNGVIGGDCADGFSYGYNIPTVGQTKTVSITVDLGSSKTVNSAKIRKYENLPSLYTPDNVKVYTSTDGTTFALKGETAYPNGLWYELSLAGTTARYVKFEATKKNNGGNTDWLFLDEVSVY